MRSWKKRLHLRTQEGETGVVRTVISIDEEENSLTPAGDVPEGGSPEPRLNFHNQTMTITKLSEA